LQAVITAVRLRSLYVRVAAAPLQPSPCRAAPVLSHRVVTQLGVELLPEVVTKVLREILVERPDLFDGRQRGWHLEVVDAWGRVIQTIRV
jgi:hypothetical protein